MPGRCILCNQAKIPLRSAALLACVMPCLTEGFYAIHRKVEKGPKHPTKFVFFESPSIQYL